MDKCEQCGKPIDGFHIVLAYDTGDKCFCDPRCANLYTETKKEQSLEEQIKELKALVRELMETLVRAKRNLILINAGAKPDKRRMGSLMRKCTEVLTKTEEALGDEKRTKSGSL